MLVINVSLAHWGSTQWKFSSWGTDLTRLLTSKERFAESSHSIKWQFFFRSTFFVSIPVFLKRSFRFLGGHVLSASVATTVTSNRTSQRQITNWYFFNVFTLFRLSAYIVCSSKISNLTLFSLSNKVWLGLLAWIWSDLSSPRKPISCNGHFHPRHLADIHSVSLSH